MLSGLDTQLMYRIAIIETDNFGIADVGVLCHFPSQEERIEDVLREWAALQPQPAPHVVTPLPPLLGSFGATSIRKPTHVPQQKYQDSDSENVLSKVKSRHLKSSSILEEKRAIPEEMRPSVVVPAVPPQRFTVQAKAISDAIKAKGYDPKSLPKAAPGHGGVKAEIKRTLVAARLFVSQKAFDRVWQRMRDSGDIADAS